MLEALLNHFRSYGMNDLEFIIVNSKLSHSQDKLFELQKRVSFPVYQETEEEQVWSVMEGGKDDMYVYDRCGRLTYYIPFPLSILNESPLVSNAILATYYQSPCGENCDQNKTLGIGEIADNIEKDFEESNTTEQENVYSLTEQSIFDNETKNDIEINENFQSNDILSVIASDNEYEYLNFSESNNKTDFEYPQFNISSQLNETDDTSMDRAKTFFTNIYRVFFNTDKNNETLEATKNNETLEVTKTNETLNSILNNGTDVSQEPRTEHHHKHHSHHKHGHKERIYERGKKKSDRCVEADYEVCKNWSKKRLLIAQKCCSETRTEPGFNCENFGKKRCKKIQSILKCCIKTVYTEFGSTTTTTEEPTTSVTEDTSTSNEFSGIACCKTTEEGKMCRIAKSDNCNEDEEKDPFKTK